jgi:periplasmic protein TonB
VTPMVDPTAKKPNNGANPDPNLAPADAGTANSTDSTQTTVVPVGSAQSPGNQPADNAGQGSPAQGNPATAPVPDNLAPSSSPPNNSPSTSAALASVQPVSGKPSPGTSPAAPPVNGTAPASSSIVPSSADSAAGQPAQPKNPQPRPVAVSAPPIPSSLKSQMASMVPDSSGNKAAETALPSIEPVAVSEAAERALLTDQSAPAYPASAKGQQGTVVLQVLIGRDGTVQDAKFLQGSLAFARAAIDGVKPWKFKPYLMNGRPVSVQTNLTLSFQPGH